MPTVSPWRVPRTQLDIHAEHIALRLLLACPQLIDRCTIELQERLRDGHDEISVALLERAQGAESAGKANVAKIYYQQALRRAVGEARQQVLEKLRALEQ